MRLSHARRAISVRLDDPISGRVRDWPPVMALAARCELGLLVADQLRLAVKGGAHAAVTIMTLVAGMITEAH